MPEHLELQQLVDGVIQGTTRHHSLSWLRCSCPYLGIILATVSSFFFSLCSVIVKGLVDINPIELATFRFIGVLLPSIPIAIYREESFFPAGKRIILVLRCFVGTTGLMLSFYAFRHMPLADASVIIFSTPVFVAIFARLFLREACGTSVRKDTLYAIMKLVALALVLCIGLVAGQEADIAPQAPSEVVVDAQSPSDAVEWAPAPRQEEAQPDGAPEAEQEEAPVQEEQPAHEEQPAEEEQPAHEEAPHHEAPEEDEPAGDHHGAEADEEHSDSEESEESDESDESEEAHAIVEELEARQQELDYLRRYLLGRITPVKRRRGFWGRFRIPRLVRPRVL